jgi:hypothetical protein
MPSLITISALAASFWTTNLTPRVEAGMVWVNSHVMIGPLRLAGAGPQ